METQNAIMKIAAAIAFSPGLRDVLNEVKRFKEATGAEVHLIHAGEFSQKKEDTLIENLKDAGLNYSGIKMSWKEGDPVEEILDYTENEDIDLLIMGALDKEGLFAFFKSSVARKISRKAKCNVLLLINKRGKERKFKRMVVDTIEFPKAMQALNLAKQLSGMLHTEEVFLVKEVHHPALSYSITDSSAPEGTKLKTDLLDEDLSYLTALAKEFETPQLKVTPKTVQGKPGYAIGKFAKNKRADLLIINAPEKHFGIFDRIFTHDLEYVLADLPCNTLIVKNPVKEELE